MANLPAAVHCGVDLQPFNSLAISAKAQYFSKVSDLVTLREMLHWCASEHLPLLLLGGGSNLVFCGDWPGLVLQYADTDIKLVADEGENLLVRAGAGVEWHRFVLTASQRGWYGIENLALIPGSVGAAPVQNIGAYGVELESVVASVEVVDIQSGALTVLSKADCQFGYRDSVFKQAAKDQYVITAVTFRLAKRFSPVLTYPALIEVLPSTQPTPQQLIDAIIAVRQNKLPDPAVIPNVGSFFKNPVVNGQTAAQLKHQFPDMPMYPAAERCQKLPAAWLIDRAGWRGRSLGPVAMHDRQALVLTNPGRGDGHDVLALAQAVAADVLSMFGVALEMEPQCVGVSDGD